MFAVGLYARHSFRGFEMAGVKFAPQQIVASSWKPGVISPKLAAAFLGVGRAFR
jgi:hypothetical protein